MVSAENQKQATILVIDGSKTVTDVAKLVLEGANYTCICENDNTTALATALKYLPDLILVELAITKAKANSPNIITQINQETTLAQVPLVLMHKRGDQEGKQFLRTLLRNAAAQHRQLDYITKPFHQEALTAVVQHCLEQERHPFDTLTRPSAILAEISQAEKIDKDLYRAGTPAIEGYLEVIALAEVMQLLSQQRKTGFLHITRGAAAITIALLDGQIRQVASEQIDQRGFLLGDLLLEQGAMDSNELKLFLANRKGTKHKLGQQLVKLGYIDNIQLHKALYQQSAQLIYEVLRWQVGKFKFLPQSNLPLTAIQFSTGVEVNQLLMEGFRLVDEWGLIEQTVGSLNKIPLPLPYGSARIPPQDLTLGEKHLLDCIDGKKTTAEIIQLSGESTFKGTKLLYRLLSANLITLSRETLDEN